MGDMGSPAHAGIDRFIYHSQRVRQPLFGDSIWHYCAAPRESQPGIPPFQHHPCPL